MSLNIKSIYQCILNFDFANLFVKELQWSAPLRRKPIEIDERHTRIEVAHHMGVPVFEISTTDGKIPSTQTRDQVYKELLPLFHKSLLIFINKERTESLWHWAKDEGKETYIREYSYMRGQPEELFLKQFDVIISDLIPWSKRSEHTEAATQRKLSKIFIEEFQNQRQQLSRHIRGIDNENERQRYTAVLLNRLIFLYFLQKRGFLDDGNFNYLEETLQKNNNRYYHKFLQPLFFEGLAKSENDRSNNTKKLLGKLPYLNGELFLPHEIELRYPDMQVDDSAFGTLFAFFSNYQWQIIDIPIADAPIHETEVITPDILGALFEINMNQQSTDKIQHISVETPPEITEYLCRQTIHQLILDKVNLQRDQQGQSSIKTIQGMISSLDAPLCQSLLIDILPSLSILDPACNSGTMLVAALNALHMIYSEIINKITNFNDDILSQWLQNIQYNHPDRAYYIKKKIIQDNLFGIDNSEEAVEITRLRLILALTSSFNNFHELETLPNNTLNLFVGNSLIGLLNLSNNEIIQMGLSTSGDHTNKPHREEDISKFNELLLIQIKKLHQSYGRHKSFTRRNQGQESITLTLDIIEKMRPFHWCYDFSSIMYERGGFDIIITKPPWEILKPTTEPQDYYQSLFLQFASQYKHQNSTEIRKAWKSGINLYKLFLEQCYNLLTKGGYCGIIVPDGICTDNTTAELRKLLLQETRINGLFCFKNQKYIFQGLDRRVKIVLLTFKKGQSTNVIPAAFERQDPEELEHFPDENAIQLSKGFIYQFSSELLVIADFHNQTEINICKKMLHFPLLKEKAGGIWNVQLTQGSSIQPDMFVEKGEASANRVPLYEGKMIQQFAHNFVRPQHWLNIQENFLSSRLTYQLKSSGYHGYRLGFRAIASRSNERTLIATILPPNIVISQSINIISNALDAEVLLFLVAIFNSFIADFYIRLQVSLHVTCNLVSHLPVPRIRRNEPLFLPIVRRAARLICISDEFDDIRREVIPSSYLSEMPATTELERNQTRAELDGLIAHLYNFTEDEFSYIMSTFPRVPEPTKVAAQNAYRDVERGLIV